MRESLQRHCEGNRDPQTKQTRQKIGLPYLFLGSYGKIWESYLSLNLDFNLRVLESVLGTA